MLIICISHSVTGMVHYNHKRKSDLKIPIVTEHAVEENTAHAWKGKVSVMKKILRMLNEFFKEYYNSFSTVCA